jgi:thymidylate kinase
MENNQLYYDFGVVVYVSYFFFYESKKKKNQLITFDRYAHDLLIDATRYKYNLPKRMTKFLLTLFPKPNLWIYLEAPIKIIEKRKKELTRSELIRQKNEYKKLLNKESNVLVVNTNQKIEKNISLIVRKMKSIVI